MGFFYFFFFENFIECECKCRILDLVLKNSYSGFCALDLVSDICKSVDFGIPVGLSYEYKNIMLDARYYFGLTKIDKTENPDTAKNRYLSITLGYRFGL